jgi:hypothetical protein
MTRETAARILRRAGHVADEDQLDQWEERAAVREHESKPTPPRWFAESEALVDLLRSLAKPPHPTLFPMGKDRPKRRGRRRQDAA